jgi:hypothetical protein
MRARRRHDRRATPNDSVGGSASGGDGAFLLPILGFGFVLCGRLSARVGRGQPGLDQARIASDKVGLSAWPSAHFTTADPQMRQYESSILDADPRLSGVRMTTQVATSRDRVAR